MPGITVQSKVLLMKVAQLHNRGENVIFFAFDLIVYYTVVVFFGSWCFFFLCFQDEKNTSKDYLKSLMLVTFPPEELFWELWNFQCISTGRIRTELCCLDVFPGTLTFFYRVDHFLLAQNDCDGACRTEWCRSVKLKLTE